MRRPILSLLVKILHLAILFLAFTDLSVAQTVSFRRTANYITLEEAFRQLEEQTEFTIAFNYTVIDLQRKILVPEKETGIKEALDFLLKESGYTYRIKDKHIIILTTPPNSEKRKKRQGTYTTPSVYRFEDVLKGYILDATDQSPLSYATVCMLNEAGETIKVAITNEKGFFHMPPVQDVDSLSIRYMGYYSLTISIEDIHENPSVFLLQQDAKLLQEVVVKGENVKYNIDRNTYLVTAEMRQGVANAEEMLDKIQGVTFDRINNTVRVGNEENVLLLVDGLQQSKEYIRNLSPERISKIEIIYQPTGRFLSGGYGAVINFVLKKDFTGYDIYARNFSIFNPADTNGKDWMVNEQPGAGMTYTVDKVNIYANYVYGRSRWNTATERSNNFEDIFTQVSEPANINDPNDLYKYNGYYAGGGINYYINRDHTLSFQGDYTYSKVHTTNLFITHKYGSEGMYQGNYLNNIMNDTNDRDFVGTLFYQGKVNEKLSVYSDFSYNYYTNNIYNYYYRDKEYDNLKENIYREDKQQVMVNLDATYGFSARTFLDMGYSSVVRKYDSNSIRDENFLDYSETRNKLFGYLSFELSESLKMKLGTGIEYIHTKGASRWNWQPYWQINYHPNDNVNINAGYITDNYYPSLYQLSSLTTYIDTILMQRGNPGLKSTLQHAISVRFNFRNRLSFESAFKFTPDFISDVYVHDAYRFYKTFKNINSKHYILRGTYDQPLWKYFKFSTSVGFYYDKLTSEDVRNSNPGWFIESEISYYRPKSLLGVDLNYSRRMEIFLLLQGYQMTNMDSWLITINKQLWKNRLTVHLSYFLPVNWGIRYNQIRDINAGYYRERSVTDMSSYKNMLLLRLNLRFNSGKIKRSDKQSHIEREEREKRNVGF